MSSHDGEQKPFYHVIIHRQYSFNRVVPQSHRIYQSSVGRYKRSTIDIFQFLISRRAKNKKGVSTVHHNSHTNHDRLILCVLARRFHYISIVVSHLAKSLLFGHFLSFLRPLFSNRGLPTSFSAEKDAAISQCHKNEKVVVRMQ